MTLLKIIKSIDCDNIESHICSRIIQNQLEALGYIFKSNDDVYGHLSIKHIKNNHVIEIAYYDNDGKHESLDKENNIIIKDSEVKTAPSKPSMSIIDSAIDDCMINGRMKLIKVNEVKALLESENAQKE